MIKRFGLTVLTVPLLCACGDKPGAPSAKPARPFERQSISVILPKLDARLIRGPILDEEECFEARTGAKVRVLTPGWNETIEKIDWDDMLPSTRNTVLSWNNAAYGLPYDGD